MKKKKYFVKKVHRERDILSKFTRNIQNYQLLSNNHERIDICDECASHIIKTEQGFACSNCGLVQKGTHIKTEYREIPYARRFETASTRGKRRTTLGTMQERNKCKNSRTLNRQERLDGKLSSLEYEEERILTGAQVFDRLEASMNFTLSCALRNMVVSAFQNVRECLPERSRFKNPHFTVPILLVDTLEKNLINVDVSKVIEYSGMKKKQFYREKRVLKRRQLIAHCTNDKRFFYIISLVNQFKDYYERDGLGLHFLKESTIIASHIGMNGTKKRLATLITIIALSDLDSYDTFTLKEIKAFFNYTSHSTLQSDLAVLCASHNILGFDTIKKSRAQIRTLKKRLLEQYEIDIKGEDSTSKLDASEKTHTKTEKSTILEKPQLKILKTSSREKLMELVEKLKVPHSKKKQRRIGYLFFYTWYKERMSPSSKVIVRKNIYIFIFPRDIILVYYEHFLIFRRYDLNYVVKLTGKDPPSGVPTRG
ncbi:MAG: hypothetical protein GF311_12035 [Candidatus Lokiarchaeota archaeon]|nr:hypothetical protein [Candidatus Lokiarchaeota archaeon]